MTVTSPDGDSSAKQLAIQHGLVSASKIPGLGEYIKSTWRRKDFIAELADARSTQQYSDSLLGRIWQLITPLLNAAIYSQSKLILKLTWSALTSAKCNDSF